MKESGKNETPGGECSSEELLAYHEAGHAVAALALGVGLDPEGVTLKGGGHTYIKPPEKSVCDSIKCGSITPRVRRRAEAWPMCALAGPVVEELLQSMGAPCAAHIEPFSPRVRADLDIAEKALRELGDNPEEVKASLKRLWRKTKNLLEVPGHCASVKALDEALLEEKTISGERAQEIAEEASRRVLDARPEPKVIRHEQE